jgi:hypothetical protein
MCLIGIAGNRGEICQAVGRACFARSLEQALETQDGLKRLWTITNSSRKPPMKLTLAYPDPTAQLHDAAARTARKPLNTCQDGMVERSGVLHRGKESVAKG